MSLLILETRADQVFSGLGFMAAVIGILPLLARVTIAATTRLNILVFGSLYDWQATSLIYFKLFYSIVCVGFAVLGAARLSIAILISFDLIKSPWE